MDAFNNWHWFHNCLWMTYYEKTVSIAAKRCTEYPDTGDGRLPDAIK